MGAWKKFIEKLRKPRSPAEAAEGEYIDVSPGAGDRPAPPPPVKREGWIARWRPGSRRDRQIAWLQAGYSEMLDLMRSIRTHLDRQEDVQHKMLDVFEQLPGSMDALQSVGKAAEQQVEVLGLLRQQVESSVHHDQQLVESMNRFNQTLGVMDETTRTSGRTVADLVEKSRGSERLLREVIERSERRFAMIAGTFLVAVLVGVAAVVYVVTTETRFAAHASGATAEVVAVRGVPADADLVTLANRPPEVVAQPVAGTEEEKPGRKSLFGRLFRRKSPAAEETGP